MDVWAWVFMPEHVHLIVRPRREVYDMATIRRAIKRPVSDRAFAHLAEHAPHWLPRLTVSKGRRTVRRFCQKGPGYDRNVVEPVTLREMIDYLHLNPVRRGLVERAVDWPWSSARQAFDRPTDPETDGLLMIDPVPPEVDGGVVNSGASLSHGWRGTAARNRVDPGGESAAAVPGVRRSPPRGRRRATRVSFATGVAPRSPPPGNVFLFGWRGPPPL